MFFIFYLYMDCCTYTLYNPSCMLHFTYSHLYNSHPTHNKPYAKEGSLQKERKKKKYMAFSQMCVCFYLFPLQKHILYLVNHSPQDSVAGKNTLHLTNSRLQQTLHLTNSTTLQAHHNAEV